MPTNLSTKSFDSSTFQPVSETDKQMAVSAIEAILFKMPDVSDAIKRQILLNGMLWLFSEGSGQRQKWKCRYRSEEVLNKEAPVFINHEHLFTRKYLKNELLSGRITNIREFLEGNCIGCLVSVEEHKRIGREENGWGKYGKNNIKIFDCKEGKWIDNEINEPEITESRQAINNEAARQFSTTCQLRDFLISEAEILLKDNNLNHIIGIFPNSKNIDSKCHAQFRVKKGRPEIHYFAVPPDIQVFPIGKDSFGSYIFNEDKDYYIRVVGANEHKLISICLSYAKNQIRILKERIKRS